MQNVLFIFGLCIVGCRMYPINNDTDVSDFLLVDDFYPENDRYAQLSPIRYMPAYRDHQPENYYQNAQQSARRSMPEYRGERRPYQKYSQLSSKRAMPAYISQRRGMITRRAENEMTFTDRFLQKAYTALNTLIPSMYTALKPDLTVSNIEAERLRLTVAFAQIASLAADSALSLQSSTRRLLVGKLLTIPSAACDAARAMVNTFIPLGPSSTKLQFGFGINTGINTDKGSTSLDELKQIQTDFKTAVAIEVKKILEVLNLDEADSKVANENDKNIIIKAFIEISKLGKECSAQVMPPHPSAEGTRRAGTVMRRSYIGNILDKMFKSCRTKADILTAFVPQGITMQKFFNFQSTY